MTTVLRSAVFVAFVLFFASVGHASAACPYGSIPNFRPSGTGWPSAAGAWPFTWSAVPGAPAGSVYEVVAQNGTGYCTFGAESVIGSTTTTSYTVTVPANQTRQVYVRLQSAPCSRSDATFMTDNFTAVPSKPAAPSVSVSGSAVTVTFTYNDDKSWLVWVGRSGPDGTLTRGSGNPCVAGQKQVVDKNVAAGTYSYYLYAHDNAGYSESDRVTVTVGTTVTPVINSFAVNPATIRAGQSAVLSFVTKDATAVTLDQGLGAQPPSGSVTVSPSTTTTYTLTAMNGSQTATATATVNVLTAPSIVVSAFPSAIVQASGSGGGATSYVLTNGGGGGTTVSLSQNGSFFTQSPSTFTLPAGGSQVVTITGLAQPAGAYEGASVVSGAGVPPSLQVPVKLLSAPPPAGSVSASPTVNRVDVAGSAGTSSTGTVSFVNSGNAVLTGVLVSDAPWLIPQSGIVTIPAGGTGTFTITIDRSKRSDADAPIGSASARLSLVYASGSAGTRSITPHGDSTSTFSQVGVNDTIKPTVGSSAAPALLPGEVALFVPGVGHVAGSVGLFISDLSIVNPPGNRPIPDLKFFYLPTGGNPGGQKSASLPTVSLASVVVADVVKNVFGVDGQVGSLQLRAADAAKLAVNATIFNVSNLAGTYGTSIPIFRSDRSIAPGGRLVLSGLTQTATSHTNLFIQETSGLGATVTSEFLAEDGSSLGTRSDVVGPFVLNQLQRVVPASAVAAILNNASTNGAKFQAYATPVDDSSGDTWSVADWASQYGYPATAPIIIPVAGVVHGANNTFFRTDVAITNAGSVQASGTIRYVSRSGSATDRPITLGPRQTRIISDVVGKLFDVTTDDVGYLLFTPSSGTFALTSRTYTTVAGQPATFGTGVPAMAVAQSLTPGGLRAIGSIEDSSRETIVAARPGTFRTNFGLVETSANPATVRVTVRYQFPAGILTTAIGTAAKDYNLAPNQFLQINGLTTDVLGAATRSTLGDLRNIEIDFQVISSTGAVAIFTSSIDNGSGDSTLRTE